MRRFSLLPQLLATPLLAGSLFLAPAGMANPHQRSSQHNWISNAVPLLLEPSNTLSLLGVGLATLLASIAMLRKENLKKTDELNNLSASIKTLETKISRIDDNLSDYDNKSSASTKRLETQTNKINRNLNDYIVQQKIRNLRDELEEGENPEEGKG